MVVFVLGGGTERDVGCARAVVVVEEVEVAAGAGVGALAGMLEFEDPFRRRSLRYLRRDEQRWGGEYVRQWTNPAAFSSNIL